MILFEEYPVVFALIDNFVIILLTFLAVLFTGAGIWLVPVAGLLLIVITAESMGVRITWLKWALCPVYAVLSGGWFGYLSFSILWSGRTSRWFRFAVPSVSAMLLYLAVTVMKSGQEMSGQLVAKEFLLSLAVLAGVLVLLLMKQFLEEMQQKYRQEQERIRQSSVSEMREKKLNRRLAQESFLLDKNARLTERENISRNIHNSVGHSITAAIMTLDAADMLYDSKPEEARKRMNDANDRIRGSLESIRRAVRTLDQESADVPLMDLMAGMDSIIDEFVMDSERHVDRLYDSFPEGMKLPHEHLEFLTGVLQEFLTNGVKHGQADTFLVMLNGDSAHISLTVKDNGHSDYGTENEQRRISQGFGLKKIISYAERCGGHAEFSNEGGFRSVVELPLVSGDGRGTGAHVHV